MGDKSTKQLIERYYTWEKLVLITALLLIFRQVFGFDDKSSLPLLNIILRDASKFPLVTSIILGVEFLFLIIEWKQSEETARHTFGARFRFSSILIIGFAAIWINLPTLTKGTAYAEISRFWYLFYLAIGLLVGALTSVLVLVTLMIRADSKSNHNQRYQIPVATRCVYMLCWPLVLILLCISYLVSCRAPLAVLEIAPWITAIPISYFVLEKIVSLYFCFDAAGKRMPVGERISKLKEIFKTHDYLYFLIRNRQGAMSQVNIPQNATVQEQQTAFRKHFSGNILLRSQNLDGFDFVNYAIDGNPKNKRPENQGIRIIIQNPKAEGLRVETWPKDEDPPKNKMQLVLKVSYLEKHANDFLQKNKCRQFSLKELFNHTIDRSVEDTLMDEARKQFPLHQAAFNGRQDLLEQFLTKESNINERENAGWTPLLAAVAQGYPKMVKFLLEHGANPDIANLQKITPLMYAARYGNLEIAKMLLDFGATLDLQDIFGETALAVAVRTGQEKLVKLFITKGANLDTRSTLEKTTPLESAHGRGFGKIARLIRKAKNK